MMRNVGLIETLGKAIQDLSHLYIQQSHSTKTVEAIMLAMCNLSINGGNQVD